MPSTLFDHFSPEGVGVCPDLVAFPHPEGGQRTTKGVFCHAICSQNYECGKPIGPHHVATASAHYTVPEFGYVVGATLLLKPHAAVLGLMLIASVDKAGKIVTPQVIDEVKQADLDEKQEFVSQKLGSRTWNLIRGFDPTLATDSCTYGCLLQALREALPELYARSLSNPEGDPALAARMSAEVSDDVLAT